MSKYKDSQALKGLTLGKTTAYVSEYQPEILQAVPRSLNRDDIDVSNDNLPFKGEDVWYGYELSWLNAKGKPIVAVAEFRFPCESENIVESKSFKLYLNSFNQSRFDSWHAVKDALTKDLSEVAKLPVQVTLFAVDDCPALQIGQSTALCIDDLDINIDDFDFNPSLLEGAQAIDGEIRSVSLVSHLLKSNCLITNQPDWASLYIDYQGKEIDNEKLLAYIISFRQHNEFHEQCVERIFCDLQHYFELSSLTVYARYTRRGGLDINPYRSTADLSAPSLRTLRQ
ncbi:NADPH-dependent 7-cyano-7-deazaguanine reductase QueF [Thalassotalea agarivorans]|uniref:NADPH-dependent 7-cyano-7-deazaguanine reductase n=1 Tax=Thalassotalea agarivorans TaxID=349064 RepID=A0A1I0FHZ0_THASX|nr:NADPH-dependent 7-cyano-7-deazaguanine reductase QueF [Thalassotalea agarivorans]SET56835.1 7-cyano-7-deazaguanine reductase [Thalassotalea agarivorans]